MLDNFCLKQAKTIYKIKKKLRFSKMATNEGKRRKKIKKGCGKNGTKRKNNRANSKRKSTF